VDVHLKPNAEGLACISRLNREANPRQHPSVVVRLKIIDVDPSAWRFKPGPKLCQFGARTVPVAAFSYVVTRNLVEFPNHEGFAVLKCTLQPLNHKIAGGPHYVEHSLVLGRDSLPT